MEFIVVDTITYISDFFFLIFKDYDLRGYKISVAMAEKSAPKPPPAFGHG